jgi:hypothetical protein
MSPRVEGKQGRRLGLSLLPWVEAPRLCLITDFESFECCYEF